MNSILGLRPIGRGRVAVSLVVLLGAFVALASGLRAQENFSFRGDWIGEFKDKTEPERDMATRGGSSFGTAGGRDRAIVGDARMACEGRWKLFIRGLNDELSGRGEVDQTCNEARAGTWKIPLETISLSKFEFKDQGEGKDKELRFRFEIRTRTPPNSTASNELIRCDAKGKYKVKDQTFEGDYKCRHEPRQRTSGQRTMASQIRGKFKLTRAALEAGS